MLKATPPRPSNKIYGADRGSKFALIFAVLYGVAAYLGVDVTSVPFVTLAGGVVSFWTVQVGGQGLGDWAKAKNDPKPEGGSPG